MSKTEKLSALKRAFEKDRTDKVALAKYLVALTRKAQNKKEGSLAQAIIELTRAYPQHQQIELHEMFFHLKNYPEELISKRDQEVLVQSQTEKRWATTCQAFENWVQGEKLDEIYECPELHFLKIEDVEELRRLFAVTELELYDYDIRGDRDLRSWESTFSVGTRRFRRYGESRYHYQTDDYKLSDLDQDEELRGEWDQWVALKEELNFSGSVSLLVCYFILLGAGKLDPDDVDWYYFNDVLEADKNRHRWLCRQLRRLIDGSVARVKVKKTEREELQRLAVDYEIKRFKFEGKKKSCWSVCELRLGDWEGTVVWESKYRPRLKRIQLFDGFSDGKKLSLPKDREPISLKSAFKASGTTLRKLLFAYFIHCLAFDMEEREVKSPHPEWPEDYKDLRS